MSRMKADGTSKMERRCSPRHAISLLRLLPRTLLVMLAVAAPVLAMPVIQGADGKVIEAPTMKRTGAGFVLLVSLQRG